MLSGFVLFHSTSRGVVVVVLSFPCVGGGGVFLFVFANHPYASKFVAWATESV